MRFSLLDLKQNCTCEGMNFYPLHLFNVATLPC